MNATGILRLARRGPMFLSVALLAMAGLAGAPVGDRAQFADRSPMANTPSGVAVDKPGNVYVSVREGSRRVIWKCTPDGTRSPFANMGNLAVVYGLAVTPNGDLYVAMESVAVLGSPGPVPSAQFDFPASLAFGTGAGEQQNLFVTNLGWTAILTKGQLKGPGAALAKVPAGVPGRPLLVGALLRTMAGGLSRPIVIDHVSPK